MTIEQITAINNGMSMLTDLREAASMMTSLEDYKEYTDQYIKALRDSGVDSCIVEHFESICNSYLPIAKDAVIRHERYARSCEMEGDYKEDYEDNHSYSLPEDVLAALAELKSNFKDNHSSL